MNYINTEALTENGLAVANDTAIPVDATGPRERSGSEQGNRRNGLTASVGCFRSVRQDTTVRQRSH
ncbi:MAG: hypothetical protein V8Q42_07540 [Anaerovoracaceae bacterium]